MDMTATVKIGRKEGFESSYNLFFSNGLRLKTDDLTFATSADKADIKRQFGEIVDVLRAAGIQIIERE